VGSSAEEGTAEDDHQRTTDVAAEAASKLSQKFKKQKMADFASHSFQLGSAPQSLSHSVAANELLLCLPSTYSIYSLPSLGLLHSSEHGLDRATGSHLTPHWAAFVGLCGGVCLHSRAENGLSGGQKGPTLALKAPGAGKSVCVVEGVEKGVTRVWVWVGLFDGSLVIFAVTEGGAGRLELVLEKAHTEAVTSILAVGGSVLTGSCDRVLRQFSRTGQPLRTLKLPYGSLGLATHPCSFAFLAGPAVVSAGVFGSVTMIDLERWTIAWTARPNNGDEWVKSASITPDLTTAIDAPGAAGGSAYTAGFVAVGTDAGEVLVLSARTGSLFLRLGRHQDAVVGVAWYKEKTLFTASSDWTLAVWGDGDMVEMGQEDDGWEDEDEDEDEDEGWETEEEGPEG
jgi:hypothetical protein